MTAILDAAARLPLLTREQEAELGRRALGGDVAARHELVRRNVRLVFRIAGRAARRSGVDVDDLVSAGLLGLWRATATFDPARAGFCLYAGRWIEHYVVRERNRLRSVVTTSCHDRRRRVLVADASLDAPLGDEDGATHLEMLPAETPNPETIAARREALERRLARLRPRDRAIVEALVHGAERRDMCAEHRLSREGIRLAVGRATRPEPERRRARAGA